MKPSDILPLLKCPVCSLTLSAPITLHCGHSLCSSHPFPTTCPISGCSSSALPALPPIPTHSTVVITTLPISLPPPPPSISPIHHSKVDVTLNNILSLVSRTQNHLDRIQPHDDDTHDPSDRPRKRPRRMSQDSCLLTHLKNQAHHSRTVPANQPLPSSESLDTPILQGFHKELLAELTCEICLILLYQPITTPCQHTFCSKCLHRSLDHKNACPVCRHPQPDYSYFRDHPLNKTIYSIILKAFALVYIERGEIIQQEERDARLDTPIFVCQLSFPGVPTFLHFFEPKYRLMLRRCLESPHPQFGMIMSPKSGVPNSQIDYGTMLQIRRVQMLSDGRSYVETMGSYRFRVLERGTLDGYTVGRIERINDCPDLPSTSTLQPTIEDLMDICKSFLERLQLGTAPWVVQRLSNTIGPMPTDPSIFSFWVALILPIDEHEKAKLFPIRNTRLRLLLVVHWIEQLNDNWWFSNGCTIL